MNRASEIEASMANLQYELENDIYNPPVLKDNKPFNMSDYIKPVRVTDTESDYTEKVANEVDEDISELTDEILDTCFANIEDNELEMEQLASHKEKTKTDYKNQKMYTDKIVDKNLNNLKKNIWESDDKIKGVKKATQKFKDDNIEVLDNVPEISKDVATKAIAHVAPFSNADKKIVNLRRLVEYEIRRRQSEKKMKKQATLLGEYFLK